MRKEFDSLICGAGLRLIENVIKARIDWPDPLQGARQAFWPTLGGVPKLSAPSNWSHLHRTQAAKKNNIEKMKQNPGKVCGKCERCEPVQKTWLRPSSLSNFTASLHGKVVVLLS